MRPVSAGVGRCRRQGAGGGAGSSRLAVSQAAHAPPRSTAGWWPEQQASVLGSGGLGLRWRCGRGRGPQRPLSSPCPAPCGGRPALRPREHACGLLPARTAGLLATPALETLGGRWPLDGDLCTHSPWGWSPARSSWGRSSVHNEGRVHFSWKRPAGFLLILFFSFAALNVCGIAMLTDTETFTAYC